jgi:hypothetical protein
MRLSLAGLTAAALCVLATMNTHSSPSSDSRNEDAAALRLLRRLARSEPETDFKLAKQKGEIYFWAMMGYAKVVPGVPEYDRKYAGRVKTKIIPGTTDAITSAEQDKLLDAVKLYAGKYNALVLDYLEHRDKHRP